MTSESPETGPADSVRDLWNWLAGKNPVFATLNGLSRDAEGACLVPERSLEDPYATDGLFQQKKCPDTKKELEILLVEMIYGTEELSTYSMPIREAENTPRLCIHTKDAERLGFDNKATLRLLLGGEEVSIELCAVKNMASGVIILPRHRQLEWQTPGGVSAAALIERIMKV